MHWYTGVVCLIVVMILMYLFIRGAQEPSFVQPKIDPFWRCKRCGMMLAADYDKEAVMCPHAASVPNGPCPMELVGEDGKVIRDDES